MNTCIDCNPSPWWHIFDGTAFLTRDHCGNFPAWLVTLWVIASVGLWVTYLGVAVYQYWFWTVVKGTGFPRHWLIWIAALFIFCGSSHLTNALAFTWPAYRAFIVWDWLTFLVSIVALYGLIQIGRFRVSELKVSEVRVAIQARDIACADLAKALLDNTELKAKLSLADSELALIRERGV